MGEFDVTWQLNIQVSRTLIAETLDEALAKARKMDNPQAIFEPKRHFSYIDGDVTVKGVYEL